MIVALIKQAVMSTEGLRIERGLVRVAWGRTAPPPAVTHSAAFTITGTEIDWELSSRESQQQGFGTGVVFNGTNHAESNVHPRQQDHLKTMEQPSLGRSLETVRTARNWCSLLEAR